MANSSKGHCRPYHTAVLTFLKLVLSAAFVAAIGVSSPAQSPLGRMSGEMTSADRHSHGLVVSDGECIAVDFPGSTATYANSIDASGNIAGRYTDAAGHTHGFFVEHIFSGWEP